MILLKQWIGTNTKQRDFAREIQCSEAHLSQILSGRKMPSLRLADRIRRATGGSVSIESMVTDQPPVAAE